MSNTVNLVNGVSNYLSDIADNYSESSLIIYRQALKLFTQHLEVEYHLDTEKVYKDQLSPEYAKSFLSYLKSNRSVETEHLYTRVLIQFYKHFKHANELNSDIAEILVDFETNRRGKSYQVPEVPVIEIENILNYAQNHRIIKTVDTNLRDFLRMERDRAFILIMSETGLRASEICNLYRRNFNYRNKLITLISGLDFVITEETSKHLNKYLLDRVQIDGTQQSILLSDLPLFIRHDKKAGNKLLPLSRWSAANIISFWVNAALSEDEINNLKERNISISPHTLRHYFVLQTLSSTDDLDLAQKLARHSEKNTTMKYISH